MPVSIYNSAVQRPAMLPRLDTARIGGEKGKRGAKTARESRATTLGKSGSQTARELRATDAATVHDDVTLDLWNMHVRAVALHQSDEHGLAEELYQAIILKAKKHASGEGLRQLLFKAMNNLALLYEDTGNLEKVGRFGGGGGREGDGHVCVCVRASERVSERASE